MTLTEAFEFIANSINDLGEQTDAGKFMVDIETSTAIAMIIKIEKMTKTVKEAMAEQLKTEALRRDPNFKGIQGGEVNASYRASGAAYSVPAIQKEMDIRLDELAEEYELPRQVLKVDAGVDAKELEKYVKTLPAVVDSEGVTSEAQLPALIVPVEDRKMSLALSLVRGKGAND